MVLPTPLQAFSGMPKASATTEKQTIVDGEKMTGAEALVRSLEDLGIKDVFGVPGGAILPVYDSIKDDTKFRFVLMRHEQAAGHAAEGYALTTGQVGVCIVTSGPGATNMITPIADANMDSIPMVVITGQVGVNAIGTDAFQEADIVGATYPVVKHSYLVTRAQDIPRVLATTRPPRRTVACCPTRRSCSSSRTVRCCTSAAARCVPTRASWSRSWRK